MAIPEDKNIGALYLTCPSFQEVAQARIAEALNLGNSSESEAAYAGNLFGMRFNNINQLIVSLSQLGWFVTPKYLMRSKWASTWHLICSKNNLSFKLIVHGFGLGNITDYVQIINVSHNMGDDDENVDIVCID
jgi:hypothetical protein